MKQKGIEIVILAMFFMVLSEALTPINILVSFMVAFAVVSFKSQIQSKPSKYLSLKLAFLWLKYFVVLLAEVVIANVQVAKIALSPKMPVQPQVITYQSDLKDPWLLTILANSITLTPGTMTVDISGETLLIHCLNPDYVSGLDDMRMARLLKNIEGELNA